MNQIITVDEKNYSLKYNEQVIETIETIEEFKEKYPNGKVYRKEQFGYTDW